ncbi:hypothetical protein ACX8Z9_17150 [Arthrobacter halodurans]|jgi:hypothetical protein|uniref:Uncharacterized protein n=1 Tax=Arthrobacter halodurans TaxID=516699 RepID=A0ABV4UQ98_9MICC
MPDKSPHRHEAKKPSKSIKEKRAEKRSKAAGDSGTDPFGKMKK